MLTMDLNKFKLFENFYPDGSFFHHRTVGQIRVFASISGEFIWKYFGSATSGGEAKLGNFMDRDILALRFYSTTQNIRV